MILYSLRLSEQKSLAYVFCLIILSALKLISKCLRDLYSLGEIILSIIWPLFAPREHLRVMHSWASAWNILFNIQQHSKKNWWLVSGNKSISSLRMYEWYQLLLSIAQPYEHDVHDASSFWNKKSRLFPLNEKQSWRSSWWDNFFNSMAKSCWEKEMVFHPSKEQTIFHRKLVRGKCGDDGI